MPLPEEPAKEVIAMVLSLEPVAMQSLETRRTQLIPLVCVVMTDLRNWMLFVVVAVNASSKNFKMLLVTCRNLN
jgi:hypothetical protein